MLRNHLSQEFFVRSIIVGKSVEKPGYRILRPNGTPNWLIIFTPKGGGWVQKDGVIHKCGVGDLTIWRPSEAHDYGTEEEWVQLWAHFHPRPHWDPLLDFDEVLPGVMSVTLTSLDIAHLTFEKMFEIWKPLGSLSELRALHSLEYILILGQLQKQTDKQRERSDGTGLVDARLDQTIRMVQERMKWNPSIKELAQLSGMSESRFAHLFRSETGLSPREYFERMRIKHACVLLRTSGLRVKTISANVGFSSAYYFSLRFKQFVGMTPTEFRRSLASSEN